MSCLSFGMKLPPARKAWKGFTSTLQRKLHKLKRSKAIKRTTNRLNTTLVSLLTHSQSIPPRLHLRRKKSPFNPQPSALRHCQQQQQQQLQHSFAPIYVDELFMEPVSVQAKKAKLPESPPTAKSNSESLKATTSDGAVDKWKFSELAFPQLRGVDERAEEFISMFKEDMRLQKQRSFGDFQEMLARGLW